MAGALDPTLRDKRKSLDTSSSSSPSSSSSLPDTKPSPDQHLLPQGEVEGRYETKLVSVLVDEIFGGRKMVNSGGPDSSELEPKKRKRDLEETVGWLKSAALHPVDPKYVIREQEQEVLNMRRKMFLNIDDVANLEDLPNFPALRKKKKAWYFSDERYKGKRRSERIAKSFPLARLAILRKRIGVGDQFQADVPDWLGPPCDEDLSNYRNDTDSSKWLGTCLWPHTPVTPPSKPMYDYCRCTHRGSVECLRHHVNVARNRLKSELGQAFLALGCDSMGEEVNEVLTHKERMLFYSLERGITPLSGPKGFWSTVSRHLQAKETKHLVSYFFNVYLLRKVGSLSRMGPASAIDSDEEDIDDEEDEQQVFNDGQSSSHRCKTEFGRFSEHGLGCTFSAEVSFVVQPRMHQIEASLSVRPADGTYRSKQTNIGEGDGI